MAAAMFSKFKKKSQKGGKTRRDDKNENALGNSTRDETEEAGSLKSGPQDEKSQKQQYDNSNGSSKPSKGQPMMSLSPDHPGSPDCSLVVGCPSSSKSPEVKTMKKNKSLATDISGANATPVESTGPQIPVNNAASANLFTPPGLRASKSHLGDSDAQNSKNIVTSSSGVTDYGYSSGPSTAASTCTNLPTQMPQIDVEVADQQQGSPCNTQSVSDTSSRSALSQNPENSEVSSSELAASNQASQMNQPAINTRDLPNPEMEDLSGVSRNENDNSLESLSAHPIQEEQNNAEASQNEATVNTYDNFFVSEKILGDKFLLEKLAVRLDRTPNRAIKSWEHLACTKEIAAPLEVRLKCKLSSEKRYTMMLFEVLTAEHEEDKTVKDLMDALTRMKRNDVKKIITDVFPDAANSSQELSEFIASPNNFNAVADVATLLDQTSNVNKYWFHLGLEFGVSRVRLKEIEYGQSTQDLMEYLYTKKPRLTIGTFCGVIENDLKRKDVLKILRPFVEVEGGRDKLMKDAIPLESDTMRSICVCLNNPSRVLRNWRYLAKSPELGIPDEVYMDCKPDKLKSPTEGLLEWATANRNDLKIGELCSALKSMDRNDIVGYIAEYFQQQSTAVQQH